MTTKLVQYGNSQAVCITKPLMKRLGLELGDAVEVTLADDGLLIRPKAKPVRGRYKLSELLKGDVRAEETDWGGPAGREAW